MAKIFISVGTNINKEHYLLSAVKALHQSLGELSLSSVYESEAVGFEGENFYNMVIGADTQLSVAEVAALLRQIENDNGRVRNAQKFSSRTLDLDLLTYDELISDEVVQLPRDEITKNAFVLWPLAEIAGEQIHPLTKLSYAQMWQTYNKDSQSLWTVPFNFAEAL